MAKKAVDSTLKMILLHTAEIIGSFILLIIVCLPLVFVIPMWLQQIGLETPVSGLLVNPVTWFGIAGAIVVTTMIALVSGVLGYTYVSIMTRSKPKASEAEVGEEAEVEETPLEEAPTEETSVEEVLPDSPESEVESLDTLGTVDEEQDLLDEDSKDAVDKSDEV